MDGVTEHEPHRPKWARSLLRSARLVGLCVAVLLPAAAKAQFNPQGRTRTRPSSSQPQDTPQNKATPRTPTQPTAPQASSDTARRDELIARYSGLLLSQPGEELPLKRLAQLVRERDGNLDDLLAQLKQQQSSAQDPYPYLVATAGLLAEDSRPELGVDPLMTAVQLQPKRKEGWLLLGRLQAALDRKAEARRSLESALPLLNGPALSMTLRTLRDLSLDLADYEAARKYHRRLQQGAGDNVFLKSELGRELLRRGQTEKAIEELRQLAESSHGDARALAPAWRDLGRAQLQGERTAEAIASLEKASKLAVAQPGMQREVDELLAQAHRQAGSLAHFLDQLAAQAASAERLELLGRLYEEEGRMVEAAQAYQRALARAPADVDVRLRLVRLLEVTGDLDGASRELERVVRASPGDLHLALRQLELLLSQGRRDETLRKWDRLETLAQSDPETGLLLVDFAERLGEPERQKRLLERLAQKSHRDTTFLVELGARFYREGDEAQARRIWNKLVELNPSDSAARVALGEVLIDHDAVTEGVSELEKAVKQTPTDSRTRRALALGLERAGSLARKEDRERFEERAIAEWQAILNLPTDPLSAKPLARRRVIRIEKRRGTLVNRLARGEQHLREHPEDIETAHLLAEGYMSMAAYGKAVVALERLLQHRKGDRQALLQLEKAHEAAGRFDLVITTLEKLVAADPARAREYYDRMAQTSAKQRDFASALRYAELAVQRNPSDPTAHAQLGEKYLAQGRTDQAESSFRRALELDDRQHQVALTLAELLSQTKRSDEALPLLFHVVRNAREPALIQRATRRALSLSVPTGNTRQLEDVLRPLALGRSEQAVYRHLLLETLGATLYPLQQSAQFGSAAVQAQALSELVALSNRSTQALLSALTGQEPQSIQIAIDLLAYGDSESTGLALLAFAESAADARLRLQAILAAGRSPHVALASHLSGLLTHDGVLRRGPLATATVWALARQHDPKAAEPLLRVAQEGTLDMRAYAAWGLATRAQLGQAQKQRTLRVLLDLLATESAGSVARAAAALALGQLFTHAKLVPPGKLRDDLLMQLQLASEDRSPVLASSALLTLTRLDDTPATRTLVARALWANEEPMRRSATVAAVQLVSPLPPRPLLPEHLDAHELGAETHVSRYLDQENARDLPAEARWEALRQLAPALAEEATLALKTSRPAARSVFGQLVSKGGEWVFGQLYTEEDLKSDAPGRQATSAALVTIREAMTSGLIELAQTATPPLSLLALANLRSGDGPYAQRLLENALASTDEAAFQASLAALVQDGSQLALQLMAVPTPDEPWARRRRRVLGLGELLIRQRNGPVQDAAHAALIQFRNDPSPLVRTTVEELLEQVP